MNTNEIQDIGEYVTSLAPDVPWYENSGMLGFGLFGSLIACIVAFHLIGFGIATYHQWKSLGRPYPWLWVKEVFRGGSIWGEAVIGKPTPRAFKIVEDSKYHKPTLSQALNAAVITRAGMKAAGWTLDAYRRRTLDCEDFCYRFKADMAMALKPATPMNHGVAVGIIGYTRKDGAGHVICFVDTSDHGIIYFEGFANKTGAMDPLTPAERASIEWKIL